MRLILMGALVCGPALLANPALAADKVPKLDVQGSCRAAQSFGDDKKIAYKGCMDDETQAYNQLLKKWAHFKPKDRSDCVGQVANLVPSYVEILTCLEMDDDLTQIGTSHGFGSIPERPPAADPNAPAAALPK